MDILGYLVFPHIHDSAPINILKYSLQLCDVAAAFLPHLVKVEHIEEVHRAEYHQYDADLRGEVLDCGDNGLRMSAVFQKHQDEAEVD